MRVPDLSGLKVGCGALLAVGICTVLGLFVECSVDVGTYLNTGRTGSNSWIWLTLCVLIGIAIAAKIVIDNRGD